MSGQRLKISEKVAERIRAHAGGAYPHECCGALLGRDAGGEREVLELVPLANQREDSPRNRFQITAEDVLRAEKKAAEKNLDLIGWYHSHPDHPAIPSEFDREHAWPWYSYIIISVSAGKPAEMNSWRLADDRSNYSSEDVEVLPSRIGVGS